MSRIKVVGLAHFSILHDYIIMDLVILLLTKLIYIQHEKVYGSSSCTRHLHSHIFQQPARKRQEN